jgi:glycerophosphoryl diester phosphodiesterase
LPHAFPDSCFWLGSLQYTMYHVKFTLKNGLKQEEPNIRIASYIKQLEDGFCFNNPTLKPKTLPSAITSCAGQLMVQTYSACDQSSGSFKICAPDITATIYQEHPWPGGCGGMCDLRNSITLAMKPNIEIPADTIVTIHGLKNAIDLILVEHESIETGSFAFDVNIFRVTFKVKNKWTNKLEVKFELTNPAKAQSSPDVSIRVQWTVTKSDSCLNGSTVTIDKAITKTTEPISQIPDEDDEYTQTHTEKLLGAGDAAVLLVLQPAWIVKRVGQSTRDPFEANTMSFTLSSNVEVSKGAIITVSGLTNFTQVTEPLTITESSSLLRSTCITTESSKVLSPIGEFDKDKGTVKLTLKETLTVKSVLVFSFALMNPCAALEAGLSVSVIHGNSCASLPVTKLGLVSAKAPDFTLKTATQSTCWPDNENCATVSFRANVKFEDKSKVHIAGGHGIVESTLSQLSLSCGATLDCADVKTGWNERLKVLTLSYNTITVPANTLQTVTVCFKNPPQAQRAPEISIWAANLCQCVVRIPKTIIEPPPKECDKLLAVAPPSFLNTKITQCHPYVGALNTITVTISTNVPLIRPRKVTISGLAGSQTPDNKALQVFDGMFGGCDSRSEIPSQIFEPTGHWSRDRGTLVLSLRDRGIQTTIPGGIYLLQFQLENPPLEQQAPAVSISGCKIAASRMQSAGGQAHLCKNTLSTTAPQGCECLGKTETRALLLGVVDPFVVGEEYGSYCAAWDDGACSSGLHQIGPMHRCGTKTGCAELRPDRKLGGWCCDSWCFVNAQTCTEEMQDQYGFKVEKASWLPGENLHYSYGVCADDQTYPKNIDYPLQGSSKISYAHYTEKTCPYNEPEKAEDFEKESIHAPLKVLKPRIVDALIGQSTASPGEINVLTVTLRVNTPVRPAPSEGRILISGFNDAIAPCGPVALFSAKGSQSVFMSAPDGVPGTGYWDCENHKLLLHVATKLEPCDSYVFSWHVTNPMSSQTCSQIRLETSHLEFQLEGCGSSDCQQITPAGLPELMLMTSDTGVFCPMTVVAPSMTIMKVSECTRVCGMPNKLDIVLEANVPMEMGSSITIGGLGEYGKCPWAGTSASDRSEQTLLAIQGRDAGFFSGKATVTSNCNVELALTDDRMANSRLEFCLPALNLFCNRSTGIPLTVWAKTLQHSLGPYAMSGRVFSGKDKPALDMAEISESSGVQRSINTLTIMFRANVDIVAGSIIEITGLIGTAVKRVKAQSTKAVFGDGYKDFDPLHVTGLSSHFFQQDFSWDTANGNLTMKTTTVIQANQNMIVVVEVQNGEKPRTQADVRIKILSPVTPSTPTYLCEDSPTTKYHVMIQQTPLAGAVLQSSCTPTFEISKIGQSTPYAKERNMLTVTVASNFDFRARTGDKVVCTISGLSGAVKAPGPMTLFGADPFASGCMTCECPNSLSCEADEYQNRVTSKQYMTFHIAGDMDAGCLYTFGFEVQNGASAQTAPVMDLICTWDGQVALQVGLSHDNCSIPSDVFEGKVGEATALFVRAEAFSRRFIKQSNAYPCAQNHICVEIQSTVPLSEENRDVLLIEGLAEAEAQTGVMELFNPPGSDDDIDFLRASDGDALESTGMWDTEKKSLRVHVRCSLQAGYLMRFCFEVTNPKNKREFAAKPTIKLTSGSVAMPLLPIDTQLDFHPMYIRTPKFKLLETEQTSPFPCDQNTVRISFSVNVDLNCNVKLTCSGFTNSLTTATDKLSVSLSMHNQFISNPDTQWKASTGQLVFNLDKSNMIRDSDTYVLEMELKNSNIQQAGSQISCMSTTDIVINNSIATICGKQIPAKLKTLADKVCPAQGARTCSEADACPLTTHAPTFLIKTIGQATAEPGASNRLCVTMAVNTANFKSGDKITISGFLPNNENKKEMKIGAPLAIGFGGSGHGSDGIDCKLPSTPPLSTVQYFIMFSQTNVHARFNDVTKYNADHLVCVQKTYANNILTWKYFGKDDFRDFAPDKSDLIITKIMKAGNNQPWGFTNIGDKALNGEINEGSVLCSAAASAEEKLRCTDVQVSMFTDTRDALHCPNHLLLKVTGDFIMPHGVPLEGDDADKFTSERGQAKGTVVLTASTNNELVLGQNYALCFHVQNPTIESLSYAIFIASSSCSSIPGMNMEQPTAPLRVNGKKLSVTVHQSSPFPCSTNTLTLRFTPNFHIRSQSVISVLGLASITTKGSSISLADASGGYDHSELFRRSGDAATSSATAVWQSSILTLTVARDHNLVAGQRYSVSVEIENPVCTKSGATTLIAFKPAIEKEKQASLSVKVIEPDSVVPLVWGTTTMDSVEVNTDMSLFGAKTLGLCGSTEPDAFPLYIYKPKLTVQNISQSSAFPCAQENIISVTLQSNVPLCADSCNARLTISNLNGALLPDGPVKLMPIDDNLDHETFAAAEKGEKGRALWSNKTETLTLFLTCCFECNRLYKFKFAVTNPSCHQSAPDIFIEGSNPMNLVAVEKTKMIQSDPDAHAAALMIIRPTWTFTWSESSQIACDSNTFSITLNSNIPVEKGLVVTISGLQDTATSMNELRVLPSSRTEYADSTVANPTVSSGFIYSSMLWNESQTMYSSVGDGYTAQQKESLEYKHRQQLLRDLQCQMKDEHCPGPFTNCETVVAHRGAPYGYPEFTKEGYEAATQMGACKLSCEAVFNKDGVLYCRQNRCDLAYTTDILTNPDNECLAKKCSTPPTYNLTSGAQLWPQSRTTLCCTSDFDAAELARLCVTATYQINPGDPLIQNLIGGPKPFLSAAPWKSTAYTSSTCPKIMSHTEFIDLAVLNRVKMVSELLDDEYPVPGVASKAEAASRLILDYTNQDSSHSISPSDVMVQSSNIEHVTTWLNEAKFNQAVLHIKSSTAVNTQKLDQLATMQPPLKHIATPWQLLLTRDNEYGNSWKQTDLTVHAKRHGMKISALNYTREFLRVGASGSEFMKKDTDAVLLLHALMQGTADTVFSDW